MEQQAVDTLAAFLASNAQFLNEADKLLFLRAVANAALLNLKSKDPLCVQSFKLENDRLASLGFRTASEIGQDYDLILYLPTKQRDENLSNFAECYQALRPNGRLICALHNDLGAARFSQRLADLFGEGDSYSKNHCRVFWAVKNGKANQALLDQWLALAKPLTVPGTQLRSRPGIFGWNKVDIGSQLLVQHLPARLDGVGADLGCGYGYLSAEILKRCAGIKHLYLYEAEKIALDLASQNLTESTEVPLSFLWHDVPAGLLHSELDWIVMNPPFHAGKKPTVGLGIRFVEVAARALRQGAALYMVANSQLPYMNILRRDFSEVRALHKARGFTAYRALK